MNKPNTKILHAVRYDDDYADSFHDESSRSTESTHQGLVESKIQRYPSNIAAACHAASTAQQQPKANDPEDLVKLEKRRKSNRLSAQRWRMRKRSKFSDLQDQIQDLKKQQEDLEAEKSELQAELRVQLALTQVETAHLNSSFVAARVDSAQRALRRSRELTLGAKLDLLSKAAVGHNSKRNENYSLPSHSIYLKAPYNHVNSHCMPRSFLPNELPTSLNVAPIESSISHANLRVMLRDATSISFTSL